MAERTTRDERVCCQPAEDLDVCVGGRPRRARGSKAEKAVTQDDELAGFPGRPSARQSCTWRPNSLWIMQRHVFSGCTGAAGKGGISLQSVAHVKGRQEDSRQAQREDQTPSLS